MRKYALYAAAVVVLFFAGKWIYNVVHDRSQGEDAAVMKERIRTDSLKLVGDSVALANALARLDSAMAHGTKTVERWNTVKVPVYLPPTSTPHDTIQSVAKRLSACYQAGDSLVQSVVKIQTGCAAFRDTAKKTIADLRLANAHLDSLYKIGKPPKRWGIGPFVGYGIRQDSAWAVKRGWFAGVGVSYHIISF